MIMFKSFVKVLCAAMLASAGVLAQEAIIVLPQPNANVTAGSDIIVQVDKPMTLTGSQEVALVIGAFPCSSTCPGVAEVLGDVLYDGSYSPEVYPDAWDPYENFTVTVPSTYGAGLVQLGVARFYLVGAGLTPQLQLLSVDINVVA